MKRSCNQPRANSHELTVTALAEIQGGAESQYPKQVQDDLAALEKEKTGQVTWQADNGMHHWSKFNGDLTYSASVFGTNTSKDGTTIIQGPTHLVDMPDHQKPKPQ
jgi:hypothetical protein